MNERPESGTETATPLAARFITFEGGEGVGKSTQIKRLMARLNRAGVQVVRTREPGGTPKAEAVRAFILQGKGQEWGPGAEAVLFAAARLDHVDSLIGPSLDAGKWVLSEQAKSDLCAAASQANGMDNALLLVVGYTDSTGSQEFNQELSEKRASRVVNHLQQACGWKPYRMLTPTGMAEADPASYNSTPEGKAQNRRVAVNILVSKAVDGL